MSQYKTFMLPFVPDEAAEEELNAFLRSHRVVAVERVREPIGWCFCVEWLDGRGGEGAPRGLKYPERTDYMKILPPEVFAVFSKLRARRKEIAQEAGVPAFSVFTDAQLAEIAKMGSPTPEKLGQIEGIGEARVKSFAGKLLEALAPAAEDSGQKGK